MLESIVDNPNDSCEDDGGNQDKQCRALQLLPSGPRHLLCEFGERLFQLVNELSHLGLQSTPEKLEAGIRCLR